LDLAYRACDRNRQGAMRFQGGSCRKIVAIVRLLLHDLIGMEAHDHRVV